MTQLVPTGDGSPFDQIRRTDPDGTEYWAGRDLQPLMEYAAWRAFQIVIEKARASLALVQGSEMADQNFVEMRKVSGSRGPSGADYRLTRFGAYLVAMAGDDTKPAVAAARVYFAVQTRRAEVTQELTELEVARRYVLALEAKKELEAQNAQQRQRLAIAEPKAEFVDSFINPTEDTSTIRVFAAQINVGEQALREYLQKRKVIYRRLVEHRWSRSRQVKEPIYEWLAYAGYKAWFKPVDQPQAPRLHNGRMVTTLYVTPVGKTAIRRLLMKHPMSEEGAA